MKTIIAGCLTLFCGLVFNQEDDRYTSFILMAFIVMIVFNSLFFIEWLFYFLTSFNSKNEKMKSFLKLYALMICKRRVAVEHNSPEIEMVATNVRNRPKMAKRKKVKRVERRTRKHIIQSQPSLKNNNRRNKCSSPKNDKISNELEREPRTKFKKKRRIEESKGNSRDELSSGTEHRVSRLNISDAKKRTRFAKNYRQEIGLTWLDDESSSDEQ